MSNDKFNILAIESSGNTSGVAVGNETGLLYEHSFYIKHVHDKQLATQVNETFTKLDMSVDKLDAVAVSSGPGSFTGLRIGGAIAKGLTYDNSPKLISVPTLTAFASAAQEFANLVKAEKIFTTTPSHGNKIYTQYFDTDLNELNEVQLIEKDEIDKEELNNLVVCGVGAEYFTGNNYQLSGLNRLTPRFILKLAIEKFKKSEFIDSKDYIPLYVQDFKPTTKK